MRCTRRPQSVQPKGLRSLQSTQRHLQDKAKFERQERFLATLLLFIHENNHRAPTSSTLQRRSLIHGASFERLQSDSHRARLKRVTGKLNKLSQRTGLPRTLKLGWTNNIAEANRTRRIYLDIFVTGVRANIF